MHDLFREPAAAVREWIIEKLRFMWEPVRDSYVANYDQIYYWAEWMIYTDGLRRIAGIMCVFYCLGLLALGVKYHRAVTHGENGVNMLPKAFLALLAIQVPPMLISGFVLGDAFIIFTRLAMLGTIIVVYVLARGADRTLDTFGFKFFSFLVLLACILGPMSWAHDGIVRVFIARNETLISWIIVLTMLAFMIGGQFVLAKDLFKHFFVGEKTTKRLRTQLPRFLMLALPIPHYWFAPTSAAQVMGLDPIFLAHVFGALGTFVVLVASLLGLFIGALRFALFGPKLKAKTA